MTHKKNSIKEFLLSLAGKGWLWGTGKEITVNPEYPHLLQGQSHYSVSSNPFGSMNSESWSYLERELGRKKNADELKSKFQIIEDEAWVVKKYDDFQDKHKHEITEIDFMCAWLNLYLCLPQDVHLRLLTKAPLVSFTIDGHKFSFTAFCMRKAYKCYSVYPKHHYNYWVTEDVISSLRVIEASINTLDKNGFGCLFKSVTYDA